MELGCAKCKKNEQIKSESNSGKYGGSPLLFPELMLKIGIYGLHMFIMLTSLISRIIQGLPRFYTSYLVSIKTSKSKTQWLSCSCFITVCFLQSVLTAGDSLKVKDQYQN